MNHQTLNQYNPSLIFHFHLFNKRDSMDHADRSNKTFSHLISSSLMVALEGNPQQLSVEAVS